MFNYVNLVDGKYEILEQIEQTRKKLNSEVIRLSCLNPSVIKLSQELDELLNEYFKIDTNYKEEKNS
ncbi:Spo0E family sporulation regulatory protein-aspartic acid phosphatase [Clostridium sp. DL1XJH146]